jgi:pimeloyl-ACP methyl ester carboxylesterase
MTLLHTARGDFDVIMDGPEDGPVVMLLHGFPELNISWRHQIPELAAAGYRAVAPTQRGYAGSVRDGSYAAADLAADVVAMLDAVGTPQAIVVGHDWGGAVAWTVAQLFPQRVRALVAMNCPPPRVLGEHLMRSPRQLRKSWYIFFFQLPVLPERFVRRSMPGMLRGGSHVREVWDRATLAPYGEAFATDADVRGPIGWYRAAVRGALRGIVGGHRTHHPITAPVLVIWGVHDAFLGMEMVGPESLRGTLAFPNEATVVPIESAGHFVQNEAPEQVNAVLLGWLAEHAPLAT